MNLTANDLCALQDKLIATNFAAPAIPGACGARKVRFAPPSFHSGQSGAIRVNFKVFPVLPAAVFVIAYPKNVQENISATDKKRICKALDIIEIELKKKLGRSR